MPLIYKIPEEYYFRIHHIRPRFKNDVESVLIFVASEISKLPKMKSALFKEALNKAIYQYPGNTIKKIKTINNWRTEISSLFGFIEYDSENKTSWPGAIAVNLAENQDLIEFFKYFLFYFQYPGAHIKPHEIIKFIEAGIRFKPAKYILDLLTEGETLTGSRFSIDKAELTHCVFNDLRVTRDLRDPKESTQLLIRNRERKARYDWRGDVIRYAGDILDYMVLADLLVEHGKNYFLNPEAVIPIKIFRESNEFFNLYKPLYGKAHISKEDVNVFYDEWYHFVNRKIDEELFKTDVFKFVGIEFDKYREIQRLSEEQLYKDIEEKEEIRVSKIGDFGECLIHGHECMRIKLEGREDLIHLIVRIPSSFAVGYDIQSVEADETKRYIEVKTTISKKSLNFNKFHLTPNEWKTAESLNKRYFVYRLMISKNEKKLFLICDPVGKYKKDKGLRITPRDGVDVAFGPKAGEWEDLLIWEN